jgi:hypothetical protein
MQDRDIIIDDGGLAADKPGGMVEKDAAADPGGRIDVGLEYRRRTALQVIGEILAALQIEPMRETMRLQRMKALEVEQWVDEARGCGVAVVDGDQIGAPDMAE